MRGRIPFVSELQEKLVLQKADEVVKRVSPECVICYGLRTTTENRWSSSKGKDNVVTFMAVDLVAIVPDRTDGRDAQKGRVEYLDDKLIDVSVIIQRKSQVASATRRGDQFFASIFETGIFLYGRKTGSASGPQQAVQTAAGSAFADAKLALGSAFLEAAAKCASDRQPGAAMFLTHQAAEASYSAVLWTQLGYRSATHNLSHLARLTENITPEVGMIFPRSTVEERKLFNELNGAYYGARYSTPYIASHDMLTTLIGRVKLICDLSKKLCKKVESVAEDKDPVEIIDLPYFNDISADAPVDIVLQEGSVNAISFLPVASSNAVRYQVTDRRLSISLNRQFKGNLPRVTVYFSCGSLNGIHILESGAVSCAGILTMERLGIIQSGRGPVKFEVDTNFLDVTLSKEANLELSGRARKVKFLNSGVGRLNAAALRITDIEATLTNTGGLTAWVEGSLHLSAENRRMSASTFEPHMRSLTIS